jgi:serine/threonine-protein kinase
VKVLDFGIAKIKQGSNSGGTVQTKTGIIMGSPAYMSPEQCKDSADVDLRSDVYSFATIVYEMLAGRTPYVAASGTELLVMHLTETPRPLRKLAPDVPVPVEATIARALSRARDDRFDSMASFMGALSAAAGGGTAVLSSPWPPEDRPAATANPVSRVERTVALPTSTTFSRATGEVGARDSDESQMRATGSRRWPILVVGGVVASGLALFLLARPSRDPVPNAAASAASAVTRPVLPVRQEPSAIAALVALPSKLDAGAASPPVSKTPAPVKRERAASPETSPSPAAKKNRSVEDEWIGH